MTQTVKVRLFARFRDALGAGEVDVALPDSATVKDVREQIALMDPGLTALLFRSQVAVNGEFAPDDASVRTGDEVALIPPVSGGSIPDKASVEP